MGRSSSNNSEYQLFTQSNDSVPNTFIGVFTTNELAVSCNFKVVGDNNLEVDFDRFLCLLFVVDE